MLANALQLLPSARLFGTALLAVAMALQFGGRLPGRSWSAPMLVAWTCLCIAGLGAAWLSRRSPEPSGHARQRCLRAAIALARIGGALLIALILLHRQVHQALDARLAPTLEGRDLEVVGIVDGMPQRFDFGDRVRFSLVDCRVAQAGGGSCGSLARLQLDWGPIREKDRRPPWAAAVVSPGGETDDDEDRHGADEAVADAVWPQPGQYWRLIVRLKRPVAPANPGGFDLELRYLQQGVGALGRVYARERLETRPAGAVRSPWFAVLVTFEGWRTRLRDRLEAVYADRIDGHGADRTGRWPMLGVVAGLALGDQGAIGAGLWGLFSRTGVSHLMAISGMHVTMLALVAAWVAGRVLQAMTRRRVPGMRRLVGALPRQFLVLAVAVLTAFAYALLSGWGIPSQRTCWMLTAAAVMSAVGRGIRPLDVTLLAAGVVVATDPWAVATAGFWLSFGAVAAILWCAHGQDSQRQLRLSMLGVGSLRVPAALRDACTSQWAATIGLAPLVIALFSTLSLIGPAANAVAIPWVSFLVTPLAIAAALLAPLSEVACAGLLQLNLWLIEQLVAMLVQLDRFPAASVAVARPGAWTLVASLVGAVALIAPAGVPMRRAGVLCLLPMLMAPQRLPASDELWVTALDMGQGSSILVESAGKRLLFDAGSGQGADRSAAARFLMPYLRSRGIETIDTLVISHLDIEHAGGAASVLQSLRPQQLLTSFDPRLLQADEASLAAATVSGCVAGRRLTLGAATVEVMSPSTPARLRDGARDNRTSCVLRIASAAGSVLLTGDLPTSADAQLLRTSSGRGDGAGLRSDVLIVPQQGSRNAASAALLAAAKPAYAVLQVGYRNRHRHPHPTVLQRLSDSGAVVLRTDQDGAVQIRLRAGVPARIQRMRRDEPPYWRIDAAAG